MGAGVGKAKPVGPVKAALPLHVVTQTTKLIVLGWQPPVDITGYEFLVNGKRVSNTWDVSRSTVQFSYQKGAVYKVVCVREGQSGTHVG